MNLHPPVYNVALGNIWLYEFINIFLRDWHWIITLYLNTPPWTLPLITGASFIRSRRKSQRKEGGSVLRCFWPLGHKKNIAQMYICVFLTKTNGIFCDEKLLSSLTLLFSKWRRFLKNYFYNFIEQKAALNMK